MYRQNDDKKTDYLNAEKRKRMKASQVNDLLKLEVMNFDNHIDQLLKK